MNTISLQIVYRLIVSVLIVVLTAWLVYQYVDSEKQVYLQQIDSEIRAVKLDIEQTIASDDFAEDRLPAVRNLFTRCDSEQNQWYEQTIAQLGSGLDSATLTDLAVWFDRCGLQQSEIHIMRADIANTHLRSLHQLHSIREQVVQMEEADKMFLDNLEELVSNLVLYANTQVRLDELQRELIEARRAGLAVDSTSIQGILEEVQQGRQELSNQAETSRRLYDRLDL